MKKLGSYLIENNTCNEDALSSALKEQLKLKKDSIFKPLGAILTEAGSITPIELQQALSCIHFEKIADSELFKNISTESMNAALSFAEHRILPDDSIIYREGDKPDSLYIIITGRVRVYITGTDGTEKTLAILNEGDYLGEIALLIDKPHKTSTKTTGTTSLLAFSQENFNKLCDQNTEICMVLVKGLAHSLVQRDEEIINAIEKERAYQQFVSEQDDLSLPELIGQTRVINQLRRKIDTAAQNNQPALIYGEPGTENLVVAGNIHKNSPYSAAPFLSMDAENIALEGYSAIIEADSSTLQLEMAQAGKLFGFEDSSFSLSRVMGLGLLQICRQGSIVIKNIEKLTKGIQKKLLDYLRNGTFISVGGQEEISSNARIIGTTSENIEKFVHEGKFDRDLLALLQANSIYIPPIRKRKGDLRLLVDFIIIMECFKTLDKKLIKGISPKAYQQIMEYDWPGNMDELQVVIRRAINLAQSDYLLPEDIFIGSAPPEGKYTINLLQFEKVKNLFSNRTIKLGLQIVTASAFSLIVILSFFGNHSPDKNIALIMVWGLWEPVLVISWFISARYWCSVCPMGTINDILNRIGPKKFNVPDFIINYGLYFSAAGLAIIILMEVITHMHYSPKATGFLLLAIALFAILSGLLFERRVWCRYLCPLGTLGAMFSGCSIVELRTNRSICNSTCKDNICYKGDGTTRGCPLYQGPFSLRSNQNCILCGNCVRLCTNDSPAFNLRVPGHELWAALKPEKITTVFMPVVLGVQILRAIEHTSLIQTLAIGFEPKWVIFSSLLVLLTVLSFAFTQISGCLVFGKLKDSSIVKGDLFIHALIPLSFAFEIGYQLRPFLKGLGKLFPTLGKQLGLNWEFLGFRSPIGLITFWQIIIIMIGMFASIAFLRTIIRKHQEGKKGILQYRRFRYLPILILVSIYLGIFLIYSEK